MCEPNVSRTQAYDIISKNLTYEDEGMNFEITGDDIKGFKLLWIYLGTVVVGILLSIVGGFKLYKDAI